MTRPIALDLTAPVRSLRTLAKVSGVEAAKAADMSRQAISNVEARGADIRLGTLVRLAEALGFEIEIRVRRTG